MKNARIERWTAVIGHEQQNARKERHVVAMREGDIARARGAKEEKKKKESVKTPADPSSVRASRAFNLSAVSTNEV